MTKVGFKAAVVLTCVLLGAGVPAAADTVEVAAVGFTFVPPNVIINEGDSVHWTGLGGGFHTVAEVDGAAAFVWNGGFHSPAAASEFTFTFTASGLYHFICEPHVLDGMRGTVTVNEVPIPADIDGDGDVDFDDLDALVAVLLGMPLDAAHVANADLNGDGNSDGLDIALFVALLLSGP